ncbi:hypothetical protein C7M84_010822 [Penaeus vannamei]|uniref:Protein stum n=1 Tax=Penaeus vannamei TaxID=6689 RepID=A0A423T3Q1_PENVA|nr:hypothetical protein C7M84_010822 [Penaeus vannamei]
MSSCCLSISHISRLLSPSLPRPPNPPRDALTTLAQLPPSLTPRPNRTSHPAVPMGKGRLNLVLRVLIENEDGEIQEFEILASKDKHGALRKAVPTLPVALAVCCLVLNMVPGLGTMVSGFAVLCGYPTEHSSKGAGVFYNLLVALLQLILAPIIVGWIWSIQRGIILVQESMNQKIEQRERRMSQDVTA